MVSSSKRNASLRKLSPTFSDIRSRRSSFITPASSSTSDEQLPKSARFSSRPDEHPIARLTNPVRTSPPLVETVECDASDDDEPLIPSQEILECVVESNTELNVLLPGNSFKQFLVDNFVCRFCHLDIKEKNIDVINIGCACNVFWKCSSTECGKEGKILSKPATSELSGNYRVRNHTELYSDLGDYDINRQVILACQQSGGGSRMAKTFCSLMSVSKRAIWNDGFSKVEQLIGKAQICLGKQILHKNLQQEIQESPMDLTLN
jgi:hypothetical protein